MQRLETKIGKGGLAQTNGALNGLLEVYQEQELVIMNTWFQHTPRDLNLHKMGMITSKETIIINNRFRNSKRRKNY